MKRRVPSILYLWRKSLLLINFRRYPLLFFWKAGGLDKLPLIPAYYLREKNKERFITEHIRHNKSNKPHLRFAQGAEEYFLSEAKEAWKVVEQEWLQRNEKNITKRQMEYGELCFEARLKVCLGGNRETVLRDLGRKILPETRGGGKRFTINSLQLFKTIHKELKDCIKEIRRKEGLTLCKVAPEHMSRPNEEQLKSMVEDAKKEKSWVERVLTDDEILFLLKGTSESKAAPGEDLHLTISEIAWWILGNRLEIHPPTLRHNLKDIPLL
ncbi:MAG: hypothetical protein HY913_00045 [Desulfomonile tiedjei]|nr:hypothetical protein [Desulfomonile tiedjei]